MPSKKPIADGSHATVFCFSAISIDGIISDHTDAAIITPEANPSKNFWNFSLILFLVKKTIAEPKEVPKNGIKSIAVSCKSIFHRLSPNFMLKDKRISFIAKFYGLPPADGH